MDDGRTGEAPLGAGYPEEGGVEYPEVPLPKESAVEVMAIEPFRAEERNDPLAVGGGRTVGVGGLGVALVLGHPLVADALPDDLPGGLVDAVEHPGMRAVLLDRRDLVINPDLQAVLLLVADRGGEKDPVFPDHGTGMAEPRDGGFPFEVFRFRDVQVSGVSKPSAMPEAEGPRNWGQLTVLVSLPPARDVREKAKGAYRSGKENLHPPSQAPSGALRQGRGWGAGPGYCLACFSA